MLKPNEMKLMTPPPPKLGKDAVTQDHYLIEKIDSTTCLIHRELDTDAQNEFPANEQFEHENRTYLRAVEHADNQADAEAIVKSVWRGIENLNERLS